MCNQGIKSGNNNLKKRSVMATKNFCITIHLQLRICDRFLEIITYFSKYYMSYILVSGNVQLFFSKNLKRSWNFREAFFFLRVSVVFQSQSANQK